MLRNWKMRRCLETHLIFFGFILAVSRCALGQGSFVVETARGYSIPDPNSMLSLAAFLRNTSVADEVKLDPSQRREIADLLDASYGSLNHFSLRNQPIMDKEAFKVLAQASIAKNEIKFREILDPKQLDRLKQVAYHIEIARIGLGEAIQIGFLGKHIGIEDYQRPALKIRIETIEAEFQATVRKNMVDALEEIAAELTHSQQDLLRASIGKWANFVDEFKVSHHPSKYVIPDLNNDTALLELIRNNSLAMELGVNKVQQSSIETLSSEFLKSTSMEKMLNRNKSKEERDLVLEKLQVDYRTAIDAIVSNKQFARLRQLACQVEIQRIGIAKALTEGRLGNEIRVSDTQKRSIASAFVKVEARLQTSLTKAKAKAMDDIMRELLPLQRVEAERLLGNAFLFKEEGVLVSQKVSK